nr:hypothetical protein [bacterium]
GFTMVKKSKPKRNIFVIMPFTTTPSRNEDDLTEFFKTNLKKRIESEQSLDYQYIVRRSEDTFDITEKIIHDVYAADVLLCDLSGEHANPNVMYELGMRLAISNRPVILFREENRKNEKIFDIIGFYIHEYNPKQYGKLEEHIIGKLRKFETEGESYQSPVLKALKREPSVVTDINRKHVFTLLSSFRNQVQGYLRVFGGVLHDFLSRHNVKHSFITIDETLLFFLRNSERLKDLPWDSFRFYPRVMPAIHAFLVELPLSDLLADDNLEIELHTFVSEYYHTFFASEYLWRPPTINVVRTFLGESHILLNLLMGCVVLLEQPAVSEKTEVIKKMREGLKQSTFTQEMHQMQAIAQRNSAASKIGTKIKDCTADRRKSSKSLVKTTPKLPAGRRRGIKPS